MERFDLAVDREFFGPPFWSEAAGDAGAHRSPWRKRLRAIASDVFNEAAEGAPRTDMRRVRARAVARGYLDGQMAKWIKEAPDGD